MIYFIVKYLNEYYNQNICVVLKGPYLVQLLLVLYMHACIHACMRACLLVGMCLR